MTKRTNNRTLLMAAVMLLLAALCACTSERKREEAQAVARYEQARQLVEEGRLEAAKTQLDSVHLLYRQQVAVRRQAKALQDSIAYLEAQRTMIYADSLLQVLLPQVDPLLKRFRYDKDDRYEDHGQYVSRLLQTESNTERNFLQAYISDDRITRVKSYYFGAKPCNQQSLEIEALPTAKNASSPERVSASGSCHAFEVEGYHSILTVEDSAAINLLQFISAHKADRLRIHVNGTDNRGKISEITYFLNENEKAALEETYRLGVLFTDIRRTEEMMARAAKIVEKYATK